MALDLIIDVATIDDLGFRVAAEEPRALAARQTTRPSRAFAVWAVGLISIAMLGAFGQLLEPAAAPARDRPVGGAEGHSLFRYPVSDETKLAVRVGRIPSLDDSIAWLAVGVRIEGPPGEVVVKLISGPTVVEQLTVPHARGDRPTASPSQEFELALRFPSGASTWDLWIIARAYVDGRVVAVERIPVDPTWSAGGPGRFVLDDVVGDVSRQPVRTYSLLRPLRS